MANLEDEVRDLREKNSELAQEVQYLKLTVAQKEKDKLDLMKELNELRLKLSRVRSGGAAQARKLDADLQTASEEALSHLVQASGAVARTIELSKQYMSERLELDSSSHRWSNLGTPSNDKVNRVPPLLIGGQSIQPVVSLSRTMLNSSARSITRSPNQSTNVTNRAVPMHMLQDVYIPLTRIDMVDRPSNAVDDEEDENQDNSAEDLGLEDMNEPEAELSQSLRTLDETGDSQRLDAVIEDVEPEDGIETPPRPRMENPLEGPSWLLDDVNSRESRAAALEPDSTTPCDSSSPAPTRPDVPATPALAFTPTVRRRKRMATPPSGVGSPHSPPHSPRPHKPSRCSRVLKVVVAKMRLSDTDTGGAGDVSPPKIAAVASPTSEETPQREGQRRPALRDTPQLSFDAPSPNGATDSAVIVSEAVRNQPLPCGSGEPSVNVTIRRGSRDIHNLHRENRDSHSSSRSHAPNHGGHASDRDSHAPDRDSHSRGSHDACDSDGSSVGELLAESRTRRPRKNITYKEKPLNRKLRR